MVAVSYPGVYIVEVPSGVRTIAGVSTSITAFVGRAARGPINVPVRVQNFGDYTRIFGGLWVHGTVGYAVSHFFQHGGRDALIVRVNGSTDPATVATLTLPTGAEDGSVWRLEAANPGSWGATLWATVDYATRDEEDVQLFNLTISEVVGTTVVASEIFRNLSVSTIDPRFAGTILQNQSNLVKLVQAHAQRPKEAKDISAIGGADGGALGDADIVGDIAQRTGLYALDGAPVFNLLCIPPPSPGGDVAEDTWASAAAYCRGRRALLLIDPPTSWSTVGAAVSGAQALVRTIGSDPARNAAIYFPKLKMADPLRGNAVDEFAPSGAIAGIIARTDAQRGVWKAPAGLEASFSGVSSLSYSLTDAENGLLNPEGVNCLRTFPGGGTVVWGARTADGADARASEWKYLPVRRLALFIEESLFRGTQWVVFEGNDEPLWGQIRLNVGAFMHTLFRQGAFPGKAPKDAYFVKCDAETTTQADIDLGIVNILVGFAPLKPAEFVVLRIQQIAGPLAA